MSISTDNRRYDVSLTISKEYSSHRNKLCWQDYQNLVWSMSEGLCKDAMEAGFTWSRSKDNRLFNMALTSASDSFNYDNF